jgi:hypothetical protein
MSHAPHIEYVFGWLYQSNYEHGPTLLRSSASAPVGTPVLQALIGCNHDAYLGMRWPSYGWPGGYEIHYYTKDGGVLCHHCANDELPRTLDPDDDQFRIVASDINYEDEDLFCDHCTRQIEPAYGASEETQPQGETA